MITKLGPRALWLWPRDSSRSVRSLAFSTGSAILVAVLTLAAAPTQSPDANADLVVVHPADPGTALDNPAIAGPWSPPTVTIPLICPSNPSLLR
jgi:hypothetical protein